jgi:hypothetical protein
VKPALTKENKRNCLQFCLSMIDLVSLSNTPQFFDIFNVIYIDEKWFYMTKIAQKYYLLSSEEEPLRSVKSKRFIVTVMFLVAVVRPRFK